MKAAAFPQLDRVAMSNRYIFKEERKKKKSNPSENEKITLSENRVSC